jgi:type IV secretion system protein VirB9
LVDPVITTDRRTYHLSLVSTRGVAMSAISWTYPADTLLALRTAESAREAAQPVAAGLDVEHLNFGYTITGPETPWKPLRAFDDGRQTFIELPATTASSEAPPLFLVDNAGGTQLVNYRLRGRYYVVDRIFDAAQMRIGGKEAKPVKITRGSRKGRGS